MLDGRFARGEAAYDRDSFQRAPVRTEPVGRDRTRRSRWCARRRASGLLLGGTLTQLAASLGTPYAFDPPARRVLFLDEVAERPYRIDRMLTQLRLAGCSAAPARSSSASCRAATSRRAAPPIRDVLTDLLADFPARSCSGFPRATRLAPC